MAGRSAVAETMDGAGAVSEVAAELRELELALAESGASAPTSSTSWSSGSATSRSATTSWAATRWRRAPARSWPAWSFSQQMQDGYVGALSGGWKMRVALARILLMRPDAMLLDEPSNHLDIESIIWLEGFLKGCRTARS